MKNHIQEGNNITLTAGGSIASGALIVVGALIGVAVAGASSGEKYTIATKGVFEITKLGTDDVAVGDLLYWDAGNSRLTKTPGTDSKPLVGVAVAAAGSGVAKVKVKLGVHGITGPSA